MSGISCLIALILPMFAASSGRYLMMLMGRCSYSFGIPIRRPFVIVSLPFLVWQMTQIWICSHKPISYHNILQPCASYGCEVWTPAAASVVPLQTLQRLQHSFLRRACRVKKGVPIQIIFEELSVTRWHDFWWRRVVSFWNAIVGSDPASICGRFEFLSLSL